MRSVIDCHSGRAGCPFDSRERAHRHHRSKRRETALRAFDHRSIWVLVLITGLFFSVGSARPARAQGAARDLSGYTVPDVAFTVSITIDPPGGVTVVGLEDAPPAGWSVSNISDGGWWDAQEQVVKWPLFYSSSGIPSVVTYDVTPPDGPPALYCFVGYVSFDGPDQAITGDGCIPYEVPTLSEWGTAVMTLVLLTAGTLLFLRRRSVIA